MSELIILVRDANNERRCYEKKKFNVHNGFIGRLVNDKDCTLLRPRVLDRWR